MTTTELVITPSAEGWRVSDADERIPSSGYRTIDEACADAEEYLQLRGGGRLTVREGEDVVSSSVVEPE